MFKYEDLDDHFTLRKQPISPFYGDIKIPRKLKKKVKEYIGCHWPGLTNGQRLWHYMEKDNMEYKRFLIKKYVIVKDIEKNKIIDMKNTNKLLDFEAFSILESKRETFKKQALDFVEEKGKATWKEIHEFLLDTKGSNNSHSHFTRGQFASYFSGTSQWAAEKYPIGGKK